MQLAAHLLRVHGGTQQRGEFGLAAARHVLEQTWAVNADAAEGQAPRTCTSGAHVVACAIIEHAPAVEEKISCGMVRRIGHHDQMRECVRGHHLPRDGQRTAHIEVAPNVTVDDEKGFVLRGDQRQGVGDAAGRFQRFPLGRVGNTKAFRGISLKSGFHQGSQPCMVDDYRREAGARETFEVPHDQGFTAGFEQGLGQGVGQRAHALAAARREDHGLHLSH